MLEARFTHTDIVLTAGDRVVNRHGGLYTFLRCKDERTVILRGVASGLSLEYGADEVDLTISRRARTL